MTKKSKKTDRGSVFNTVLYVLFAAYNIVYLGFIGFASVSLVNAPFLFRDDLPWNVVFVVYILFFVPIISVILGLFTRLRKEPRKLAMYLFAVEIPIVVVSLLRLLFIRQMTGIYWLMFLSVLIAMLGFVVLLLKDKFKKSWGRVIAFLSQEVALIIGAYFAFLTLFFLPIIVAVVVKGLLNFPFAEIGRMFVYTKGLAFFTFLFFFILFCLTVGLFVLTPVLAFIFYWKTFKSSRKALESDLKEKTIEAVQWGVGISYVLLSVILAVQLHGGYDSSLVDKYLEADSFEEQQLYAAQLISRDSEMKQEFRNKYLAPYRYFIDENMNFLTRGYEHELYLPASVAGGIQGVFNVFASPFVYQRDFDEDVSDAKNLYEKLFDQPLQKGESNALLAAMSATNTGDELKAGILDAEKKTVRLVSRDIKVEETTANIFAKVTVEEEFENVSDTVQEVYYEFYLPEGAVVTDLRLGASLENKGVIAPKGAARSTYNSQVRLRVDPALLEQVGPRQYRLRVFPIPVKPEKAEMTSMGRFVTNSANVNEENQKVKYSYYVVADSEENLSPKISVRRNLFEDENTLTRDIVSWNGETGSFGVFDNCANPGFTVNTSIGPISYLPHHSNPALNDVYDCSTHKLESLAQAINGKKIAFLFDASYSAPNKDWSAYLRESLPIKELLEKNSIDGYFFTNYLGNRIDLRLETLDEDLSVVNFGSTSRLSALSSLPDGYDAVIMFTDSSDNDLEKDVPEYMGKAPVYIVHDGDFPQYRDELTRVVYASGGGVYGSAKEAFQNLILSDISSRQDVLEGGDVLSVNEFGAWIHGDGFNVITAVRGGDIVSANFQIYVDAVKNGEINDETLARIHQVAMERAMVTPYSSLIALVSASQAKQLERASEREGKFEAQYDVGNEHISDPSMNGALELGGVPEPEEWALLIVGGVLIAYLNRRKLLEVVVRR